MIVHIHHFLNIDFGSSVFVLLVSTTVAFGSVTGCAFSTGAGFGAGFAGFATGCAFSTGLGSVIGTAGKASAKLPVHQS